MFISSLARSSVVLVLAFVFSLTGVLLAPGSQQVALGLNGRPDIVLFYLDDVAQYPLRMWNDASITPELARFANAGVRFKNAISASPMCGPSRASVLTGTYPHRNGVVQNDIGPYRQTARTLGPSMRRAGYKSVFIGKHINGLRQRYPTKAAMAKLADGWSAFDAIWENGGRYYDWRQYRKDGSVRRYGTGEKNHSTYRAVQRAVGHIRNTPSDKPIFLFLSLYDGHEPITPLPRFRNDRRCRGFAGWSGGSYNEWAVADKPRYVRERPRLRAKAFALRTRCEQQLTVDWAVSKVRQALQAKGRYWDTLQIITSDHGYLMGDHRIIGKTPPYSTPVPLFMRWPKAIGAQRRVVNEPVSNVDLPATFCAIAGCDMGDIDGRSLLPLIRGTRAQLDRDYLYTEMQNGPGCFRKPTYYRPEWSGVETTKRYSKTLWAYTRYRTGEEELYDLSHDRYRKRNLAQDARYGKVLDDLRSFRREVWQANDVHWCEALR